MTRPPLSRVSAFLTASAISSYYASAPTTVASSDSPPSSFIQFLGSGSSTGCPKTSCIFKGQDAEQCSTSLAALVGDPSNNKDYRGNPSLLISHRPSPSTQTNVIIDAGKTFRESLLRVRPQITHVSGIVLTHEHMDAYGGLDDIRGVQLRDGPALPIWCGEKTLEVVRRAFPYLMPRERREGEVARHVSKVDFKVFSEFKEFAFGEGECELKLTPLPFVHGEDCTCYGFAFGGDNDRVLYISDVSRIEGRTMEWIKKWMGERGVEVLVVDALLLDRDHMTHFGMRKAAELIRELR
jgi:phosphoribosyl 1,2-cyclic phosphodiesterase